MIMHARTLSPSRTGRQQRRQKENQTSCSAKSERPRCKVGQLWPKVEDWNLETMFTNIIGLSSTTVTQLASKVVKFGGKRKIRAITPLKVIQGHRGRYQSINQSNRIYSAPPTVDRGRSTQSKTVCYRGSAVNKNVLR